MTTRINRPNIDVSQSDKLHGYRGLNAVVIEMDGSGIAGTIGGIHYTEDGDKDLYFLVPTKDGKEAGIYIPLEDIDHVTVQ